jgi:hypothetical protein
LNPELIRISNSMFETQQNKRFTKQKHAKNINSNVVIGHLPSPFDHDNVILRITGKCRSLFDFLRPMPATHTLVWKSVTEACIIMARVDLRLHLSHSGTRSTLLLPFVSTTTKDLFSLKLCHLQPNCDTCRAGQLSYSRMTGIIS